MLARYLRRLEEIKLRDHRVIGKKLDLFSINELSGPGLVIFHPRGMIIRNELIKLMREINERLGYKEVYTPHVYRAELWKVSGHYDLYRDKMLLFNINDEEYGIKPMNCPGHILIYKSRPRSYKELPLRFSEFGTVYRWEQSGELYGLLRVRGFTQDDGHAFLKEDQIKDDVKAIIREVFYILNIFGFRGENIRVNLSTRPEKSIGTDEQWEKATDALFEALKELELKYNLKKGEGAFYGPKVDVDFRDSLGRWWQCSTIQVDFALPERFKLEYKDSDGSIKRPVMIHRALLGSIERFMAILLENFSGRLPTWLSPIQAVITPITTHQTDYSNAIYEKLINEGIRCEVWDATTSISKRIKRAYEQGIPYILIIGEDEKKAEKVTIRGRGNIEVKMFDVNLFIELLKIEIKKRRMAKLLEDIKRLDI